ncbi:TfpX/TfpZ family type IV pilin accessory protein [Acinetobacter dispersus]|uniref:TfpX/TfpZ family type IV pilin accessory protein n=1 Tax=Acinetobacter dispersus TaxID=70348 RepID=UPI0021CD41AC|nr:TfpX/TfpZ family type IV pilin accessory protein [Acinetobacter dispersus]MCU4336998.1 type IV pilin accessory protein [Acinetobacter dispersus]
MSKRIKFFLGHLGISSVIALILIGLVFFVWYPFPLAKAVGVTHIFLLIITIDVILGPLLGFLVYKEGKKTLVIDLSIIILIQVIALMYGFYSIAQGRPVWLVFNVDQFEMIRNNEIYQRDANKAQKEFQSPPLFKPKFAAVEFSKDKKIRQQEMFDEVLKGITLSSRPERYVDLSILRLKIQSKAQNLDTLRKYNQQDLVDSTLKSNPTATGFIPLKATSIDMVVLINKNKGEVVKIVDLRPWK